MYLANSSSVTHHHVSPHQQYVMPHAFGIVFLAKPMIIKGFTLTSSFEPWGHYVAFLQVIELLTFTIFIS